MRLLNDPLVIDEPARIPQRSCNLAVAVAAILPGQLDDVGDQWLAGEDEFLFDASNTAAITDHNRLASHVPAAKRQARAAKGAAFSWSKIGGMYREFLKEVVARTRLAWIWRFKSEVESMAYYAWQSPT